MDDQTFKIIILIISGAGSLILLLGTALLVATKKTVESKVDELMTLYTMTLEDLKGLSNDMSELKPIVKRNKEDIQSLWKRTGKK